MVINKLCKFIKINLTEMYISYQSTRPLVKTTLELAHTNFFVSFLYIDNRGILRKLKRRKMNTWVLIYIQWSLNQELLLNQKYI